MRLLPFLLFCFVAISLSAQNPAPEPWRCGEPEMREIYLRDPAHRARHEAFEARILEYYATTHPTASKGQGAPYILPVVVHIIHDGGTENISDAQVQSAIDHLNEAFAAESYYQQKGAVVNTQIRFCLAKRAPDGSETTGITRNQSAFTDMVKENDDLAVKNLARWNPLEYVNIWVVRSITSVSSGPGVAGYAYFPGSHGEPEDGMVCEALYFGASHEDEGVFIHEMGHYLGLYHTFEGGCSNNNCLLDGDRICDTPPDQATHSACPYNSCNTDVAPGSPFVSDVNDMTENFMDYSPFSCYYAFSQDQSTRMQGTIETVRKSLLDSKGCGEPCTIPVNALFSLPGGVYYAGQTVHPTNQSTGTGTYTWEWDGTYFSNQPEPDFPLTATGNHTITLYISNSDPNCTDKYSVNIEVLCPVIAGFSASASTILLGGTVTFTDHSIAATTWKWYVNNVELGSGPVFNHTFSAEGDYTVLLEAGNGYCNSQNSVFVHVTSPCAPEMRSTEFLFNIGNRDFYPYGVLATSDQGLLTYGQYSETNGHTAIIQKTNVNGDVIWAHRVEEALEVYKIVESPNDNTYVTSGINKSTQTLYLLKSDAFTGATIWKKDFSGGPVNNYTDLVVLPGGDIIAVFDQNQVARFSPDGSVVWAESFATNIGGGFLTAITRRPDGILLIVGFDPGHGADRSSVIFMDENGAVVNTRYYWWTAGVTSVIFNDIVANSDNSFVIAGSMRPAGGIWSDQFPVIFKCNASGDVIWAKKGDYQATASQSANKNYLVKSKDGGYFVWTAPTVGALNRMFYKIDGSGKFLWARILNVPGVNMNLTNIDSYNSDHCWVASHGNNRLLIANVDAQGSVGGCNEQNLSVVLTDLPLGVTTTQLATVPLPLSLTDQTPTLTPIVFPKSALCSQTKPCPEICDNGYDDDDDGYIDCYDVDCPCAAVDPCNALPPANNFSAKLAWESFWDRIYTLSSPLVANMDPQRDTIPEIICRRDPLFFDPSGYKIYFYKGDGSNQTSPAVLTVPSIGGLSATAAADLNADKIPELIIVCTDGKIRVYTNYNPAGPSVMQLWLVSDLPVANFMNSPSVADLDEDGIPEIYAGNYVFRVDLSNPSLPVLRRVLTGVGPAALAAPLDNSFDVSSSVAADLLTRADCNGDPDCDGLEIAAGYAIYSIDMDPTDGDPVQIKIQKNLHNLSPGDTFKDGYTSVADVDLDGTPDMLVAGQRNGIYGVYAWNKNGLLRFFRYPATGVPNWNGSIPCIDNVFDDRTEGAAQDFPEILVSSNYRTTAFNMNAATLKPATQYWWTVDVTDYSGYTAATVYDFNGDGLKEVVFRDEVALRIIYGGPAPFPAGVDADRNWFSYPAFSSTADESPVVADVDADGAAEIVTIGNVDSPEDYGRLMVFKHAEAPWMPCRQVWNQHNYHVTHINDDLSVPAQIQKHWLEFPEPGSGKWPINNYLSQRVRLGKNYQPLLPAADAQADLLKVVCENGGVQVSFQICNQGSKVLAAGTPVQFYSGDPRVNAVALFGASVAIPVAIPTDSCISMNAILAIPSSGQRIFGVVNDDGSLTTPFALNEDFPSTDQLECNYENNVFSLEFAFSAPGLNLGPDLELCSNSVVQLSAPAGFSKYRWQDGNPDSSFTAFQPGKYWVDAWDLCGQKYTDTVQITVSPQIPLELGADKFLCPGDSVFLTANVAGATLTWSAATGELICQSCPGIWVKPTENTLYRVLAQNQTCFAGDSIQVLIPDPMVLTLDQTNQDCNGTPSHVVAIVDGGAAPFAYLWSNAGTSNEILGAPPGPYSLTVTDAAGCSAVTSGVLPSGGMLTLDVVSIPPSCNGSSSGAIQITANGGAGVYTFDWSDGGNGNNLAAGTYAVTVTDALGCSATAAQTLVDPAVLELTVTAESPACHGNANGSLTAATIGGTGAYAYAWPGGGNGANLPAGTYTVTVTDALGCSVTASAAITDPPVLLLNTTTDHPDCSGTATGAISVTAVGGAGTYAYAWPGGGNGANLAAGTYLVTVTDAMGCTATASAMLIDPPILTAITTVDPPDCFGTATGAISVTAAGGSAGYTFTWPGGGDGTNLVAGIYTVTVTDALGCTATANASIIDPPALILNTIANNPECNGQATGSISTVVAGGTGAYAYAWPGGGDGTDLPAGIYTVTVTDAAGCSTTSEVTLIDPPALVLTTTADHPDCYGEASGAIPATAVGGTGVYAFAWPGGGNGAGLSAGTYIVTVTDAAGCTDTASATLLDPPALILSATIAQPDCSGTATGGIQVTAVGGTGAYAYAWPGGGNGAQLAAGTYVVTVSDAVGCKATLSATLIDPPKLELTTTAVHPDCFGAATGAIQATAAGGAGGLGGYTYAWPGGGDGAQLPAGSYTVTVSDANGCTATLTAVLIDPPQLVLTATATPPDCFGAATGAVQATAGGGTGAYTYAWPGSGNGAQLPAGTYTVTVTDAAGCTASGEATLVDPPALILTATALNPDCFGAATGEVQVAAVGGTGAYAYEWSVGDNGTELAAGTYAVTVTDASGCSATLSRTLVDPPAVQVDLVASDTTFFAGQSITLTAIPSFAASFGEVLEWQPTSYFSTPFDWSASVTPAESGWFSVKIADENGCTATDRIWLEILDSRVYIPNAIRPGSAENGAFTVYSDASLKRVLRLEVYDRWGELLFENSDFSPNDAQEGWDGTFRGNPMQPGVYVYRVQVQFGSGIVRSFKGDLTLLR